MSDIQSELMEAAVEIVERQGPQGDQTARVHPVEYAALLGEVSGLLKYSGPGTPPALGMDGPLRMTTSVCMMQIIADPSIRRGTFYLRCDNGMGSTTGPFKCVNVDAPEPPPSPSTPPRTFADEFQDFVRKGRDDE